LTETLARAGAGSPKPEIAVLLREKDLPPNQLKALAISVRGALEPFSWPLLIHSRTDLCRELNLHGIHLAARQDPSVAANALGLAIGDDGHAGGESDIWLGLSRHADDDWSATSLSGASHIFASPFATPISKPGDARPVLGGEGLRNLVLKTRLPVFALGGITPANVPTVRQAGAHGIAVCGSVMDADDPALALEALVLAWRDAGD
jgi:thiamine-phosphate pyrophosphorylase